MFAFTIALFATCYGFGRQGRINRYEAGLLIAGFVAYTGYLAIGAAG
jgi:cation:H+ antiporter